MSATLGSNPASRQECRRIRNQALDALPPTQVSSDELGQAEAGAALRQVVPARQHRSERVVEQVHALQVRRSQVGERLVVVGDGQVELPVMEPRVQARHVLVHDGEPDRGVLLLEPGQHRRQERRQRRGERPEPQPTEASTGHRGQLLLGGVQPRHDGARVPEQDDARLGQLRRPAGAVDDGLADRALERGDVLAHRRLRQPEGIGRCGERTPVRDLGQHPEPTYLRY